MELFSLHVTVPPNTAATVALPTANPASVRESGRAIGAHPEIKPERGEDGSAQYVIGSGDYDFTCKTP